MAFQFGIKEKIRVDQCLESNHLVPTSVCVVSAFCKDLSMIMDIIGCSRTLLEYKTGFEFITKYFLF